MRSLAVRALVLAGVVAVFGLGARSARPAAAPFRVTLFGDSVADVLEYVPEARQYLGQGLDLNLQLAVCRRLVQLSCPYMGVRPPTVLDLVRAAAKGDFGSVAVVDVGYNDYVDIYGDDMTQVVRALLDKGVEHIIWTTLHESRDDYRVINQTIRATAAIFPQVVIADWSRVSEGRDWFNSDGIHMNAGGALGLAQLLRPAILALCGDPCQSVPPPVSARTSFVIRATGRSISVGSYDAWNPPQRGTFAAASVAFGSPTACRSLPGGKSLASWSSLGLDAQFIAPAGHVCIDSVRLYLQTVTVRRAPWRTSTGLAVGDRLAKLGRLYPRASSPRPGSFLLAKADRGTSHAAVYAAVRGGRVTAFSVAVRNGD